MAFRLAIVRALIPPAFLLAGCATPPLQSSEQTVSISRGLSFGSFCASTCLGPDKVTVTSDGVVIDEVAGHQWRSRITAAEAAEFRKTLAPYRPGAKWPPPVTCEQHAVGKARYSYRLTELVLTWSDRNGTDRLVACDTPENASLSNAISDALKFLQVTERP